MLCQQEKITKSSLVISKFFTRDISLTNGIPKDYSGKVRLLSSDGSVIFNGTMEKSALTGKGMLYDYCGNILYEGDFENQLYNGDGISYYGKSSTAYIDNKSDELYICDVGKNSKGTYWAKVETLTNFV